MGLISRQRQLMGLISQIFRLCNPFVWLTVLSLPGVAVAGPPIVFQNPCTEFGPIALEAADLNGDGNADLVVVNFFANSVSVLLGGGDATFRPTMNYPVGSAPMALAVGDMTLDGYSDVLVTNSGTDDVRLLKGFGNGNFAPATVVAWGVGSTGIAVGDIDADGILDLAVADVASNVITLMRGEGTGFFETLARILLPDGAAPVAVAFGDLNRNGHTDLVVANRGSGSVSVFLDLPPDGSTPRVDYGVGGSPVSAEIVDATADGQFDIVAADKKQDVIAVLVGDGEGNFTIARYPAAGVPVAASARDLNGDVIPDLVAVNSFSDSVTTLAGTGRGDFEAGDAFSVGTTPLDAAVVDLNRDGKADIMTANFDDDDCSLLLNLTEYNVISGDVNGDGRLNEVDLQLVAAELFDGDGDSSVEVPRGYVALDTRADANQDGRINSADLVMVVTRR
jgi:hypothetical protein